MSLLQVIFSADFITALLVYSAAIIVALPLFDRIHQALDHTVLQWPWDHLGMPLLRAVLVLLFIVLSYPSLFAVSDAPAFAELLQGGEGRFNFLVNLLFITTLLVPLLPVIGEWDELVLPIQAVAATALVFSWLAAESGVADPAYWPGTAPVLYIAVLAFITHWLAVFLAGHLGDFFDGLFNVSDSGILVSRVLVLLMQSPAILIYSMALGKQLGQA